MNLGKLSKVSKISAQSKQLECAQTWVIGKDYASESSSSVYTSYPDRIEVMEGQKLEFPVFGLSQAKSTNLSLLKVWYPEPSRAVVLEDLF